MAEGDADGAPAKKKSDLGVRTVSAIVMVAIAGVALWLGGWAWTVLVAVIGLGVMWEWHRLVAKFPGIGTGGLIVWNLAGLIYVGFGAVMLRAVRHDQTMVDPNLGILSVLLLVGTVAAIDIGAYFAGRTIGGPKIAPKISPSKTWAGLGGGMVGAILAIAGIYLAADFPMDRIWPVALAAGPLCAIVAQAGDFFESWMKRRAGVKDSGNLIPGHGGFFDRTDGLIALACAAGLVNFAWMAS